MAFTQSGIHVNLWDAKCFVSVTRQFVFDSAPLALWITDMHVKIKKAPGKKVAPWRLLGKPQHKKSTVQTVFVQIAFQPPHPQANGRFVGAIFAENLSIF